MIITVEIRIPHICRTGQIIVEVRRQKTTSAEEVARFQRLFPNMSWLTSGFPMNRQLPYGD